jgi:phosphopantothenate synthetase
VGIAAAHGKVDALDSLIGEKPDNYAQAAATRPEFARELPRFVAEAR